MSQHAEFIQQFVNKAGMDGELVGDVGRWKAGCRSASAMDLPIDAALLLAVGVDRLALAFASGYQSALKAMVPQLEPEDLASLCVTEEAGNRTRHIETRLQAVGEGYELNGSKKFITCAVESDRLLVAASMGQDEQGRNRIGVVNIASNAAGVVIEEMPPLGFVPEVSHGLVSFENVAVESSQLLSGDGYERYVKPFRTVEDIHVNAAVLAYLYGVARRLRWPLEILERLLLLLLEARELSTWDPSSVHGHLLLEVHLQQVARLVEDVQPLWGAESCEESQRWRRDRKLLGVAASMREQRLKKARAMVAG